ncbi:MAG: class I SAM-dependent methyltransferase [Aureispira sp.]
MNNNEKHFAANRELWNHKAALHVDAEFYDQVSFEQGRNSLNAFELELLGAVNNTKTLHVQCHFGQDSLSLTRMGAQVTGVDFSQQAINTASDLSKRLELPAQFVCCNVLDMEQHLEEKFDLAFASYGICGWFPDFKAWARQVAQRLELGGRLILVDFHPALWMFDKEFTYLQYSYFNKELITEVEEATYTGQAQQPLDCYSWNHSLADIISAFLEVGLTVQQFKEYDYSPYPCFSKMVPRPEGGYYIKGLEGKLPMVYGLELIKTDAITNV